MFKRIIIFSFSFAIILSLGVFATAQDKPVEVETEPTVIEEQEVPVVVEEKVKEETSAVEETESTVIEEKEAVAVEEEEAAKQVENVQKIDEPKPLVKAKSYSDGDKVFVNSSVKFKLSSVDNLEVDKIQYQINSSEIKSYETPFVIEDEGKHLIKYFGLDKSGNKENEKNFEVVVDNTAPAITVNTTKPVRKIGGVNYITKNMKFIIKTLDASSGVASVEYSINGNSNKYLSAFMISEKDEVELSVKAVDNVLNLNEKFSFRLLDENGKLEIVKVESGSIKFKMDNEAPAVEISKSKEFVTGKKKNVVTDDTIFSITAKDNASGVKGVCVRIDGKGEFAPYVNPIKFATNGNHVIETRSVDKMGNVSKVVSLSVYVDTVAPKTKMETVE